MSDDEDNIIPFADRDREPRGPKKRGARRLNMCEALDDLRKITKLPRFPTPFPTLNAALGLGGHVGGQIIVVAGGTGMGKTTLLLTLAQDYAEHHGPVLFVTLEMRAGHCVARASAPRLKVSANELLWGDFALELDNLPISTNIEFVERCTLGELRETVEEVKRETGRAPLVIIDYLQKLVAQAMVGEQRPDPRLTTAAVSATLLGIARDLEVPLVVASATGRGSAAKLRGTQRSGRRGDPRELPPGEMVDVSREASDVEYDAMAMLALHVSEEQDTDGRQIATLTVAKSRFGRAQHIAMAYDGASAIWTDMGRVERKKKAERDDETLSAERATEIQKLEAAVAKVLELGPQSTESLRKALKKRRDDIILATSRLSRAGIVTLIGSGPKVRWELIGQGSGRLPGMDDPGPGGRS